jgi:hypothetical protein
MGKLIDSLAASIVLDVDLRDGEIRDRSATAAAVTPTGTLRFGVGKFGRHLQVGTGASFLSVADAAAQRITSGTLIVLRNAATPMGSSHLISKRSGGGTCFTLSHDGVNTLTLYDGTAGSTIIAPNNAVFYAATSVAGQKPRFHVNGAFIGLGSVASTFATTAGIPLLIGNIFTGAAPANGICRAILLNTVLTDAQIAAIYEELTGERGTIATELRNPAYPYPLVQAPDTRPLIEFDMETRNGAKLANLGTAGAAYDTTPTGAVSVRGAFDKATWLSGASPSAMLTAANIAELSGATKFTVETVLSFDDAATDRPIVAWSDAGAANMVYLRHAGAAGLQAYFVSGGVVASGLFALTEIPGVQYLWRVEYDGTQADNATRLKMYLNGVQQTPLTFVGTIPASLPVMARPLQIGSNTASLVNRHLGSYSCFRMWVGTVPTAAENTRRYRQFQRLLRYRLDMQAVPVTLANVTAGQIPGTQWMVNAGTHSVAQDATTPFKRWFVDVGTGTIYRSNRTAYGTFLFDFVKVSDAGTVIWCPIMSLPNGKYSDAGQNGYMILVGSNEQITLYRVTGGAVTGILGTANAYIALSTVYRLALTRNKAGVFTLYIKGGAYATWTLVSVAGGSGTNPVTDATHTSAQSMNVWPNAGDKTAPGAIFEEPLDPTDADTSAFLERAGY